MNFHGNPQVRELPDTRRRRNGRWSTVKRWQGTEEAIRAFIPQVTDNALDEVDWEPSGDGLEFVLSVTAASALDGSDPNDTANTIETWSAITQIEQRSILNHPKFAVVAAASEANRKAIQKFHDDPAGNPDTVTGSDATSFIEEIKAQKTSTGFIHPVLTLQRNVSLPSGATVGDLSTYIAKVFTRAQLVNVFDPPANILAQMPTGGAAGEWLCMKSDLSESERGWNVAQEFAHGPAWSFVYTRWT